MIYLRFRAWLQEVDETAAVLGKATASGKYKELDPAAVDGSEVAAGILYDAVDASAADAEGVAIVRLAEVNATELVLAGRYHRRRADHCARRARRAHHHRPLTPGNSLKEHNADARSGHLLRQRLLHGGADRCHQQDALRTWPDRPARPVPRAGRLHDRGHDRGARGDSQPAPDRDDDEQDGRHPSSTSGSARSRARSSIPTAARSSTTCSPSSG